MKTSLLGWSLLSLLTVPTVAASAKLEKRGNRGVDSDLPTVFNGLDVPAFTQLTPDNFDELTKDGHW